MVLAGLFLSTNDAITKWLVPNYPPGQIIFIQAILIATIVAIWMRFSNEALFEIRHWRSHFYRGVLYAIGSFAFVNALWFMPLAEVVTIAFAGPLFMTLFGRFFLKETVGIRRLIAVSVGFVGVLIVIRPGSSLIHWSVLLPLIVAVADALRDVVTRTMTTEESSKRIILTTAIILALAGAATSGYGWKPLQPNDFVWYALCAASFVVAHFFLIEAFRYAPVVVVAPFKYVQLIWSILAGLFFWGEVPDTAVFIGLSVIAGSGLYIAWCEVQRNLK